MAQRWSDMEERGVWAGIVAAALVYRLFGRLACLAVVAPFVVYFYLSGAAQREAARGYLRRLWRTGRLARMPGWRAELGLFFNFATSMMDRLAAWTGDIRPEHIDGVHDGLFAEAKFNGRGGVVFTAHLGSPDVVRAVATTAKRFQVNVLMHTANAENFNRMIERFGPEAPVKLIQVSQLDMGLAMRLAQAVQQGEWVVLAADRVGVRDGEASAVTVDFLGERIILPTGPYVLASALGCPAYTMFCTRRGARFHVDFKLFADRVTLPRRDRGPALAEYAREFAARMEAAAAETPFQWFNFYDYWLDGEPEREQASEPDAARLRRSTASPA